MTITNRSKNLVINAENAALKSEKFSIPNNKARMELFATNVKIGLQFHTPPTMLRSSTTTTNNNNTATNSSSQLSLEQKPIHKNNKSLSAIQTTTPGSSRLLREAILDEEKRNRSSLVTKDNNAPSPAHIPYLSRSTLLLQDFKKGLVSSSKKLRQSVVDTRKSQLKLTLNNGTTTSILLESVNESEDAGTK